MAKENSSCSSVLRPRFLFELAHWARVVIGARQSAWGRNGRKGALVMGCTTFQSLENTSAEPFINLLLFSYCEVILHVADFSVVQEFSGEISLCSQIGRVKTAQHALKNNRCQKSHCSCQSRSSHLQVTFCSSLMWSVCISCCGTLASNEIPTEVEPGTVIG